MANNDLKKIKELLEIVKHKVDKMEVSRTGQSASIHLMKDQQSVMNEKLDAIGKDLGEVKETQEGHTRRLEALAGDTEQLLMDVKGIRDKEGMAHSRNKREIDEIKRPVGLPLMPDIPE